jgi:hypothetical protein
MYRVGGGSIGIDTLKTIKYKKYASFKKEIPKYVILGT